jgi:hypothetical protein
MIGWLRLGMTTNAVFVLATVGTPQTPTPSPSNTPTPRESTPPSPEPSGTVVRPAIVFNHEDPHAPLVYRITAAAREQLNVRIVNTCPRAFSYSVEGVLETAAALGRWGDKTATCVDRLSDHVVTWTHDDRYGGYLVRITKANPAAEAEDRQTKTVLRMLRANPELDLDDLTPIVAISPTPSPAPETAKTLREVTLVIHVDEPKGFATAFGAGFLGSNLTDPVFAIRTETENGVERSMLRENADARDDYRLGVGSFVHAFHEAWPYGALSFGLGVNDPNRVTYYGGITLRAPGVGALTFGPNWGPTRRLPDSLTLDTAVAADTSLNDLPLRTKRGWFFSVSFEFLSKPDALQKPFASAFAPPPDK